MLIPQALHSSFSIMQYGTDVYTNYVHALITVPKYLWQSTFLSYCSIIMDKMFMSTISAGCLMFCKALGDPSLRYVVLFLLVRKLISPLAIVL